MTNKQSQDVPYIPPEKSVKEVTVLALVLGGILSILMGAANTYLGLKAGMTVSASIPAAVISTAILRGIFRRGTILENNIVQTMASTGESLAAGAIFTIPALLLVGAWQEFEFWPTTIIVMLGGLLGIVFMVPLRRALIVERKDLVYPEGVACSEVLIAGQEGGAGIRSILIGLGFGGVFKFLETGLHTIQTTVEGAVAAGRSVFYFGSEMSLALVAVGYIVRIEIASLVFFGGVIGWIISIPIMGGAGGEAAPVDLAWDLWSTQVRYIGVGTMLVGGIYSIYNVRRSIWAGVSALGGVKGDESGAEIPRTEQNMPLPALATIFLLVVFGTLALYTVLIQHFGAALAALLIMILAAFIFVAVATYIAGLVGSSNSPVSGMTICALLMTAGVLLALGVRGESAILATLGVAGVVCCAACTAGDVAQDLKTGLLVGATPAKQQWTEMLGAVIPAFFFAPVLTLLHHAYGIGTGEEGSLLAPQAALFASLTEGFFGGGTLPWNMVGIGSGIGVALIILDEILEAGGSSFRAHVMPVAVGIYLPLALGVPIFIGGLLHYFMHRRKAAEDVSHKDRGVLFGSGLIAGEALVGIFLAIPIAMELTLPEFTAPPVVSVVLFAGVILWFAVHVLRSPETSRGNSNTQK